MNWVLDDLDGDMDGCSGGDAADIQSALDDALVGEFPVKFDVVVVGDRVTVEMHSDGCGLRSGKYLGSVSWGVDRDTGDMIPKVRRYLRQKVK